MSSTDFRYWLAAARAHEKIKCPEWWENFCITCSEFGMAPRGFAKLKVSTTIPGDPGYWFGNDDESTMSYTWIHALKTTTDLVADHLAKLDLDEYALEGVKKAKSLDTTATHKEVEGAYSEIYSLGFGYAQEGCHVESSALDCVGSLLAARFDTSNSLFLQAAYEYAQANKEAADILGRGDDGDATYSRNWRVFAQLAVGQVVTSDGWYYGI